MSPIHRWLDPTGLRAAILFAVLAALANSVWVLLDHTIPSWDQAHYLDVTWHYQQALAGHGPINLFETVHSLDPGHGPLFTLALLPFFYLLSDLTRSGLLLNLILAPVLYVAAGEIAMHLFRDWRARLLTILLVATMPLMVGLLHQNLQDFPLTTLATLSLLLLLKSDLFRRRWLSLALGVTMGLGTLTKVTFPAFVAGPLLVIVAQLAVAAWTDRTTKPGGPPAVPLRQTWINVGGAALIYCILVLPWYLTNLSATLDYVRSTTNGPLAEGVGPSNPYTFHAIFSFTVEVMNFHVTWIVLIAGVLAIALNLRRLRTWFSRPLNTGRLFGAAFLIAWVLIPYLSLALGHNQDIRLMAPALPGIAVIVAGAIAGIEFPRVRIALTCLVALMMIYQVANHVTPLRPSFLPRDLSVQLGSVSADLPLDSRALEYEALPRDDYGTPIIRYLESAARRQAKSELVPPDTVCLLQSGPVVNLNTFGFLVDSREDPFVLEEPLLGPGGRAELADILAGCDFALYAPPPPIMPGSDRDRVALVNAEVAANHMTPQLFALFEHRQRKFPVSKSAITANPADDDNKTSSNWMHVLTRRTE